MEETLVSGSTSRVQERSEVQGAQLPLSFLKRGQKATIAKVRGKDEIHHHLENLGFVVGAPVSVISEQAGNLIVEVKGCQVALNKQVATKIITK